MTSPLPLFMDASRIGPEGLRDFFWPVPIEVLRRVRDRTLADVAALVRQARTDGRPGGDEMLTLAHYFLRECLQWFQAGVLVGQARTAGFAPEASDRLPIWAAMIDGRQPDVWPLRRVLAESFPPANIFDVLAKSGEKMRKLLSGFDLGGQRTAAPAQPAAQPAANPWGELKKSIHSRKMTHGRLKREIVTTRRDQPKDIISRHARECGEPVSLAQHKFWFGPVQAAEAAQQARRLENCALLDDVLEAVRLAWAGQGLLMDARVRGHLAESLVQGAALVACHLQRLERRPRRLPLRLWTGSCGNLWDRMLRIVVRRHGGHVTGHMHAGGAYIYRTPELYSNELLACDRFMTYGEERAVLMRRNIQREILFEAVPPEIVGLREQGPPLPAPEPAAGHGRPGKPRVMLVMNIFHGDTSPFTPNMSDQQALDWLGRLSAQLSSWGAELVLKPHPEGPARPPDGLAAAVGASLVNERFEQVMDQADIFLYDFPCSTTLKHAMAAGKPIVLVDFGYFEPDPAGQRALESRCAVVRGWFDDRNRPQIDWPQLRGALEQAWSLAGDTHFYDTYLR